MTGPSIDGVHKLHHQGRAFWGCIAEKGKTEMVGSIVTGCVAGMKTGCAPAVACIRPDGGLAVESEVHGALTNGRVTGR
jgi:hypothetical protein